MESKDYHVPILLNECINALDIHGDGIYIDCTLGGGGHSQKILDKLTTGKLIAIDKDYDALNHCKEKFKNQLDKIIFVHSDFKEIANVLEQQNIDKVDGILIDLGVSSWQLDEGERGFSYIKDAKLDMRMDTTQELTAYKVVNEYPQKRLFEIIRDYGEDKFAQNIAKNICIARQSAPITTTTELADIVDKSIPYAMKKKGGHPAKRTFQAIRIEVNGELKGLDTALITMIDSLKKNGRLAVLTFHSLEDRIAKNVFRDMSVGCICPKDFPICVCNHKAKVEIQGKIIVPSESEIESNSRAASAKLRVIKKII